MSESEIRKYDPEETELKALFGEKFQDKSHEAHSEPVAAESDEVTEDTTACEKGTWSKPVECFNAHHDQIRKVTACAKTAVVFGGLNLLLFYWEQTGLMAESIAVPSMCVCAALMGLGIGKVVGKR